MVFVTNIDTSLVSDVMVGKLIDYEVGDELEFTIPTVKIAEPAKFRMNEVQAAGATLTYLRRYLYYQLLDFCPKDEIDAASHSMITQRAPRPNALSVTPTPAANPSPAPAAAPDPAPEASDEQKGKLMALCEELYSTSPDHSDFVQEIAVKTNSFKQCAASICDTLITNIQTILQTIKEAK